MQIVTINGVLSDPPQQRHARQTRHTDEPAPSSLRRPSLQHVYADTSDDDADDAAEAEDDDDDDAHDDDGDSSLPDVSSVIHPPPASRRAARPPRRRSPPTWRDGMNVDVEMVSDDDHSVGDSGS